MTNFRKILVSLAALALFVVAIQALAPSELLAQIRAALVRDVDNPTRQGITLREYNNSTNTFNHLYTVPAGKILALEGMNCSALGEFFAAIFAGSLSHANIVMSAAPSGESATVFVSDTDSKAYLPAGTVLNLRMYSLSATQITCTVTGHVIDAALQ